VKSGAAGPSGGGFGAVELDEEDDPDWSVEGGEDWTEESVVDPESPDIAWLVEVVACEDGEAQAATRSEPAANRINGLRFPRFMAHTLPPASSYERYSMDC